MQYVTGPTHKHCHTLDLIYLTWSGLTVSYAQIVHVATSDHYWVFFEISVCTKTVSGKRINMHYLTADSVAAVMELMSSLPPLTSPSVDTYVGNFSFRLTECINFVESLKTKMVSGTIKAQGRNSTSIAKLRRHSRRAERQWKHTKLTVHHDICRINLKMLMQWSLQEKLSLIEDNFLFSTIDRLLNPQLKYNQNFSQVQNAMSL